jgi:hypothetical protein
MYDFQSDFIYSTSLVVNFYRGAIQEFVLHAPLEGPDALQFSICFKFFFRNFNKMRC